MTPTPTTELANASNDILAGFANMSGLTGPLLIIAWIVLLIALIAALQNKHYFNHLINALGAFAVSMWYAVHGAAAITTAAVATYPVYLLATADPATRGAIAKYAAVAVAGYAFLVLIGVGVRRWVVEPVRENARDAGVFEDPRGPDQ